VGKRYYEELSWQIGVASITRLVEVVLKSPAETLAHYASWLKSNFIDANDQLLISIHAFLIRSGGLNIIVDTCSGNGKKLPLF